MKFAMITAGTVLIAGLAYWLGLVFDFEYPYTFTLWRAKRASDSRGRSIKTVIDENLGQSRWHTCSYCSSLSPQSDYDFIRVSAARTNEPLYLLFHRKEGRLIPATRFTLEKLPWLKPENVELIDSDTFLGSGDRILKPTRERE